MVKKKVDLNHDGVDDGVNSGEFLHWFDLASIKGGQLQK